MTDYPPRMRGLVDRLERAARIATHLRYAKVQAALAAAREAVLRAMSL